MKCVIIFCNPQKIRRLHKSTAHISANNSKTTNHISLTGTDLYYCKPSKNTTLEENLHEKQRINYISGIVQTFKSKVLVIYAATYIVDCTVFNHSNNSFLFIQCSYFHICLYRFFLRFVFFHFPCFIFLCTKHILKFTLFDSNEFITRSIRFHSNIPYKTLSL